MNYCVRQRVVFLLLFILYYLRLQSIKNYIVCRIWQCHFLKDLETETLLVLRNLTGFRSYTDTIGKRL